MSLKPTKDVEMWAEDVGGGEEGNGEIEAKKKEIKKMELEKKKVELEAELEKKKAELRKLKSSIEPSEEEALNVNPRSDLAAKILAEMVKSGISPEQASEYLSKISDDVLYKLYALTSRNPILPAILFKTQQPQQLTAKDIAEINKSIVETAQAISGQQAGGGGESIKEVVETIANVVSKPYQTLSEAVKELKEGVKDALQKREDALVTILKDETLFNRFAKLASPPQPQATPSSDAVVKMKEIDANIEKTKMEFQMQLERMRQEHEKALKLIDLEIAKIQREAKEKRARDRLLSDIIKRIGKAVAEGLEEGASEKSEGMLKALCPECKTEIILPPEAQTVTCSKCGKTYAVKKT
jgi:ribosomal protein S27AE